MTRLRSVAQLAGFLLGIALTCLALLGLVSWLTSCSGKVEFHAHSGPVDTMAPPRPPAPSGAPPASKPAASNVASLLPVRLVILPRVATLAPGEGQQFCGYVLADDDTLRLLKQSAGSKECRRWYDDSFPTMKRGAGYPVAYERAP